MGVEVIIALFGVVVSAGTALIIAVRHGAKQEMKVEQLKADNVTLDEKLEKSIETTASLTEEVRQMHINMERMLVGLIGIDGQNGMRGEMRVFKQELKAEVAEIRSLVLDLLQR